MSFSLCLPPYVLGLVSAVPPASTRADVQSELCAFEVEALDCFSRSLLSTEQLCRGKARFRARRHGSSPLYTASGSLVYRQFVLKLVAALKLIVSLLAPYFIAVAEMFF